MALRKVDDAAYEEGKKLFRKKRSLRSVVEPILAGPPLMTAGKTMEDMDREEAIVFSRLLGFADAVIDRLRGN